MHRSSGIHPQFHPSAWLDSAAADSPAAAPPSGLEVTRQTFAVVLAGGRGTRLGPLTAHRAKPALPFAGQLAIVDFALSNCVHSGLRRIAVMTQYKAQSLIRHIERGWHFLDINLGEFIDLVPAQQQVDEGWYSGTANAVFQNLGMLLEARSRHVLVQDSLLLPGCRLGREVHLKRVIVDKRCVLPEGLRAGFDPVADARRFFVSPAGVVVITPEML